MPSQLERMPTEPRDSARTCAWKSAAYARRDEAPSSRGPNSLSSQSSRTLGSLGLLSRLVLSTQASSGVSSFWPRHLSLVTSVDAASRSPLVFMTEAAQCGFCGGGVCGDTVLVLRDVVVLVQDLCRDPVPLVHHAAVALGSGRPDLRHQPVCQRLRRRAASRNRELDDRASPLSIFELIGRTTSQLIQIHIVIGLSSSVLAGVGGVLGHVPQCLKVLLDVGLCTFRGDGIFHDVGSEQRSPFGTHDCYPRLSTGTNRTTLACRGCCSVCVSTRWCT